MKSETLNSWKGEFGDKYTEENEPSPEELKKIIKRKVICWGEIFSHFSGDLPQSILDVGSNIGNNLKALKQVSDAELFAVEPNDKARGRLIEDGVLDAGHVYEGCASSIPLKDHSVDMAFTSGVLIHVPPEELLASCEEIYRVTRKYILCIEYFSDYPESKIYRGQEGYLFKRDFGSFWLENFKDLKTLHYGFFWQPATGLNNLTWWLFAKTL